MSDETVLPEIGEWTLDDGEKRRVALYANRLQFVTWDRFISYIHDGRKMLAMYGWIEREDDHADFVLLQWDDFDNSLLPRPTTSSAQRSLEIVTLLYGDYDWFDPSLHQDCVRVEDHFSGCLNWVVRLPA